MSVIVKAHRTGLFLSNQKMYVFIGSYNKVKNIVKLATCLKKENLKTMMFERGNLQSGTVTLLMKLANFSHIAAY